MSEVQTELPVEKSATAAGNRWLNTYINVTRAATEQITKMQNRLDTIRSLLDEHKYEDVVVLTDKWRGEDHCEMVEAVKTLGGKK